MNKFQDADVDKAVRAPLSVAESVDDVTRRERALELYRNSKTAYSDDYGADFYEAGWKAARAIYGERQ